MDAKEVGLLLQSRRQAMGMSLNDLTRRMGGSPGASFLSKIETGKVSSCRTIVLPYAENTTFDVEFRKQTCCTGLTCHPMQQVCLPSARRGAYYAQSLLGGKFIQRNVRSVEQGTCYCRYGRRNGSGRNFGRDQSDGRMMRARGGLGVGCEHEPPVVRAGRGALGAHERARLHVGGTGRSPMK